MIWFNGEVYNDSDPIFTADNRGHLLGDGCFTTLLVENGNPIWAEQHLQRLHASCIFFNLDIDSDSIRSGVSELCTTIDNAALRISITRRGGRGLNPKTSASDCLISASPLPDYPDIMRAIIIETGIDNSPVWQHKSTSYAHYQYWHSKALSQGYDTAILLNKYGNIAGCSIGNIVLKQEGAFITPPVTDGCLAGIAAQMLFPNALRQSIIADDLISADNLLITNSIIQKRQLRSQI